VNVIIPRIRKRENVFDIRNQGVINVDDYFIFLEAFEEGRLALDNHEFLLTLGE
jgi:hypothetical protein